MTTDQLTNRADARQQAAVQSLALIDGYPVLSAWLNRLFESYTFNAKQAFGAESRLCAKGLPLEYAVVWPSHSVRCTVDVLPQGTPGERLKRTLRLAGPFRHTFQHSLFHELSRHQPEHLPRYGAWLGVREEQNRTATKIYLELADHIKPVLFGALRLPYDLPVDLGIQPVMLGLPLDRPQAEIYFQLARADRPFIRWILSRIGFPDRTDDIFRMLEQLCDSRLDGSLDWSSLGFSITCRPDGQTETVTFYSFASSAIGSDHMVREQVMNLGRRHGWDMRLYAALSAGAVGTGDLNIFHGMVGVAAGHRGPVHFTTGICPASPLLA